MIAPRITACVLVTGLAGAGMAYSSPAEAQRRWVKPHYSQEYDTGRPARGYEGFLFPDYYCSYKRYPRRVCSTDKRGRQRCRVVGWRLEQTCQ
jgi:hypothetical protein